MNGFQQTAEIMELSANHIMYPSMTKLADEMGSVDWQRRKFDKIAPGFTKKFMASFMDPNKMIELTEKQQSEITFLIADETQ